MSIANLSQAPANVIGALEIPILIDNPGGPGRRPVTTGIPFPKGALRDPSTLGLFDPEGRPVPLQVRPLVRWSDGSIRWLLIDSLLGPERGGIPWSLREVAADLARPADFRPIGLRRGTDVLQLDTGPATFLVGRTRVGRPVLEATVGGRDVIEARSFRVALVDSRGWVEEPRIDLVAVEDDGPLRATVRLDGEIGGRARCRLRMRLCFFAGTGLARVRMTVHNPERARHRGGLWDLGDRGSIFFRDLSLELALAGIDTPRIAWVAEPAQDTRELSGARLEIYQDSSGGENWASCNHVNHAGRVPCSFRGYLARGAGWEESGPRANPSVRIVGSAGSIAATMPEFWQQFPKAFEVEGRRLRLRPFPGQFGDLFELQGGERKTHQAWLEVGPVGDRGAESGVAPLAWVHRPPLARATPEWLAESGAFRHLAPAAAVAEDRFEAMMAGIVAGDRSFAARREVIDEYGWRHYGEVYADHEAAFYRGDPPVVSHYNNQYDVVLGLILQYGRSGDPRWFDLLDPLARHVIDVDIYHTDRDKAAYNGGLFWHSDHYKDASTATHRSYSRTNRQPGDRSYGGGPGAEHNYTTGLLHYYYLTGDAAARDAVIGLADWVISMDDGRRNVLGIVDDGPTGNASRTDEWTYHGPGRGAGNSINALLDGWLITGRRGYLDAGEALIRRTIHPDDEVAARRLLETELRWSYTVYLSVLDRYLALKAEAAELDAMYDYARKALVRYATWMAEHEIPYLDRPEQLEYPTETWAAQEFRKANVLRLAAAHVEGPLRARFLARGRELADRAWADLLRFEVPDTLRALALLMHEGTRDAYFRGHDPGPSPRPAVAHEFESQEPFVAQKDRVRAHLRTARGIARLAARLTRGMIAGR